MKNHQTGLILGALLSVVIVITNVVVPEAFPDDNMTMLLGWGLIALVIIVSGYIANKKEVTLISAIKAGAIVSLIGFIIAMLTFLVIDNVFLNIVSQQPDKIWNFQHHSYTTMRAMINQNLLRGLLIGIPMSAIFGGVFGVVGGMLGNITNNRKTFRKI